MNLRGKVAVELGIIAVLTTVFLWLFPKRRTQLNTVNSTFAVTSGTSAPQNPYELQGTAQVAIKTIKILNGINGTDVTYPVTWSSVTTWKVAVRLNPGANDLYVKGYDRLRSTPHAEVRNPVSANTSPSRSYPK